MAATVQRTCFTPMSSSHQRPPQASQAARHRGPTDQAGSYEIIMCYITGSRASWQHNRCLPPCCAHLMCTPVPSQRGPRSLHRTTQAVDGLQHRFDLHAAVPVACMHRPSGSPRSGPWLQTLSVMPLSSRRSAESQSLDLEDTTTLPHCRRRLHGTGLIWAGPRYRSHPHRPLTVGPPQRGSQLEKPDSWASEELVFRVAHACLAEPCGMRACNTAVGYQCMQSMKPLSRAWLRCGAAQAKRRAHDT